MIWYPCVGEKLRLDNSLTDPAERATLWSGTRPHLRFRLPLPVSQNLPERGPDVEAVQLKR